jgi:phosphoribosylamine--glycine ligase
MLLKNSKVKVLYHIGANEYCNPTTVYTPLDFGNFYTKDFQETLLTFIRSNKIDLLVAIEHKWQLWQALQDLISSLKIPSFLPSRAVGMLEWSKLLGKDLFNLAGVPTANYKYYSVHRLCKVIDTIPKPFVIKFDQSWRYGNQTIIVDNENYKDIVIKLSEEPNQNQICIIEDYIEGTVEFSYHAVCNTVGWKYLGSARDYKKRYEGDKGFNTVGMGSYGLLENVNPVIHLYVDKILAQLKLQGIEYTGFMYLGIKIDVKGTPYILELNTRSGDPEIQSILPLIKNDLLELMLACVEQRSIPEIETIPGYAVTLRIIHKEYTADKTIQITEPVLTPNKNIKIYYNNERSLLHSTLTCVSDSRMNAADKIYNYLKTSNMGDYTYRTDIGYLD